MISPSNGRMHGTQTPELGETEDLELHQALTDHLTSLVLERESHLRSCEGNRLSPPLELVAAVLLPGPHVAYPLITTNPTRALSKCQEPNSRIGSPARRNRVYILNSMKRLTFLEMLYLLACPDPPEHTEKVRSVLSELRHRGIHESVQGVLHAKTKFWALVVETLRGSLKIQNNASRSIPLPRSNNNFRALFSAALHIS